MRRTIAAVLIFVFALGFSAYCEIYSARVTQTLCDSAQALKQQALAGEFAAAEATLDVYKRQGKGPAHAGNAIFTTGDCRLLPCAAGQNGVDAHPAFPITLAVLRVQKRFQTPQGGMAFWPCRPAFLCALQSWRPA